MGRKWQPSAAPCDPLSGARPTGGLRIETPIRGWGWRELALIIIFPLPEGGGDLHWTSNIIRPNIIHIWSKRRSHAFDVMDSAPAALWLVLYAYILGLAGVCADVEGAGRGGGRRSAETKGLNTKAHCMMCPLLWCSRQRAVDSPTLVEPTEVG